MTNAKANTAAAVAPQGATTASEKAPATKEATSNKATPQGRKTLRPSKTKTGKKGKDSKKTTPSRKAKAPDGPRRDSKTARILELIRRPKGASLVEIMQATHWQAHSVRGFLSTATHKYALKITSAKNPAGERIYTAK
jgi:hypothetical protein